METQAQAPADTAAAVVAALEDLLPESRPLPLHEPHFAGSEWERVKDCLDSGWVSSVGAYVDRFEADLAEYTGIPHTVATVNGTAALHTCLVLAGVEAGDEVLLPALTFVGTANPVATMGAVPHFVDSSPSDLGIDCEALSDYLEDHTEMRAGTCHNRNTGRPIRALVVVHVLGHIGDLEGLRRLADRFGLVLIEDAAEALGSWRDGRHAGSWGDLAALSFNGNKIITTGGGGAVLCNDPVLAKRARHLGTTAKLPHAWAFEHDEVGFNYRMPNLNAALGVAQLERLPNMLAAKQELAARYRDLFRDIPGAVFFTGPPESSGNQWLNLLLLEDASLRDGLLALAHQRGLQLRPFWTPMHHLPMYRECPHASLPVAEDLFSRGICLPSSAGLGKAPEPAQ